LGCYNVKTAKDNRADIRHSIAFDDIKGWRTTQAGDIVYNASDQTESIKIGVAGTNQVTEKYTYDSMNGLLKNQKAIKNDQTVNQQTLLDLNYDYARNNSIGNANGKTGHLTKITDNLNTNKNKEYEYDALGRLTKAKGGTNNLWSQQYGYDRGSIKSCGNGKKTKIAYPCFD
jgi:hypothetical protein